jgi:uncharacterized protein (DUF433 family)
VKENGFRIYGNKDPRGLPAYTVSEAAQYLLMPRPTLRSWVAGRPYPTRAGQKYFRPLVALPQHRPPVLSFVNLVEVHVLDALRREHQIPLDQVRVAIDYLRRKLGVRHPLADQNLETDGLDIFVQKYGQLINITREGQLAIRQLLQAHLRRIDRDPSGLAVRLYPFTRKRLAEEPKAVVIDPLIAFGRPVLAGTGIRTAIVADRYKGGESVDDLAKDYGRQRLEIEEAIRCELQRDAA